MSIERAETIEVKMHPAEWADKQAGIAHVDVEVEDYDLAFWRLIRLAHVRAYRILGVAEDAEDIAAETLARAAIRWKRLQHPVDAWVTTVATRLAIDRQRKAWRNLPLLGNESDRPDLFAAVARVDNGEQVNVEQRIDLARALAQLPKRQRQVLSLAFLSGFTEAEIGELLECSASSVQTHKQRGLSRLRTVLNTPKPSRTRISPIDAVMSQETRS